MTSSKPSSSRLNAALVARILKTVGIVLTLAALLDILIAPLPYQPLNAEWRIQFAGAMVDRGLIPLVGIALLFIGLWIEGNRRAARRKTWQTLRFWALLLAGILGLFYLILFPFHLNNVRLSNQRTVEQVNQQATQAETQIDPQLSSELTRQRARIGQLIANEEQLNQVIESGQIPPEQAELLRQFQSNPQAIDQYLNQQIERGREELQTQVRARKQQALQQAKITALKSGLQVGLGSLLLAIGYLIVSWTGLKNVGRAPRR